MRFCAILLMVLSGFASYAQTQDKLVNNPLPKDSLSVIREQKGELLLDSLQTKIDDGRITKFLLGPLFKDAKSLRLKSETDYYKGYEGLIITDINVICNPVYPDDSSRMHKFLNSINIIPTRPFYIRSNLFFKVGDTLSSKTLASNEHYIRNLPTIVDAVFVAEEDGFGGVHMWVVTYDKWSVGAEINYSKTYESYFGIYDKNFLGIGHELRIRTNYFPGSPYFSGIQLFYKADNIFGTFFHSDFMVGKGHGHSGIEVMLAKDIIRPSDYSAGIRVADVKRTDSLMFQEGAVSLRYREVSLWGGKAWYLKGSDNSVFVQGKLYSTQYPECSLPLSRALNPFYHDHHGALLTIGIFRENHYKGQLIYGFGRTEDIPKGYNISLMGGYDRNQFRAGGYGAISYTVGFRPKFGYVSAQLQFGSYVYGGKLDQGVVNVNIKSFSNMLHLNRTGIRQFLNIYYTGGINRLEGEMESLDFNSDYSLRNLDKRFYSGENRLIMNTESVMFTPINILGFKFAYFAYLDVGWIGDDNILTRRPLTAVGLGLRIKNDRFIIPNFQFSFGVALNKTARETISLFHFSTEEELNVYKFLPLEPAPIPFR